MSSSKPLGTSPKYCSRCQTFEECQYSSHPGFRPITTDRGTSIEPCQHLFEWRTRRRRENRQTAANIPEIFRNCTFADFKRTEANLEALVNAAKLESCYINLDIGKTMLLSIIGNEHIKHNRSVQYITAAELTLQLRYTNDNCEERLKHFQTVDVLLIDDLGTERRSDYNNEQLLMVLDGRLRNGNITVIASATALETLDGYSTAFIHKLMTCCNPSTNSAIPEPTPVNQVPST